MALGPVNPDQAYEEAQQLAVSGSYASAIGAYTDAIKGAPGDMRARVGRGLAFQRLGDHSRALADFDYAISSSPDWPGAFIAYYGRAVSRQAIGEYEKAISDCRESIRRDNNCADALFLRGTIRKTLGNIDAGIQDMNLALKVEPGYGDAFFERGKLRCLQGRWDLATIDFSSAIQNWPENSPSLIECLYLRGMSMQETGAHVAAIADFTRVIEAAPSLRAFLRRSRSYKELGEFALAAADFECGKSLGCPTE